MRNAAIRADLVTLLDRLAGEDGAANLRGAMTRVPESAWYRRPPRGCPADVPDDTTLARWAATARLDSQARAKARALRVSP